MESKDVVQVQNEAEGQAPEATATDQAANPAADGSAAEKKTVADVVKEVKSLIEQKRRFDIENLLKIGGPISGLRNEQGEIEDKDMKKLVKDVDGLTKDDASLALDLYEGWDQDDLAPALAAGVSREFLKELVRLNADPPARDEVAHVAITARASLEELTTMVDVRLRSMKAREEVSETAD